MPTTSKIKNIWQCIGHKPTRWALGNQVGETMQDVRAVVTRRADGQWDWAAEVPDLDAMERQCGSGAASVFIGLTKVSGVMPSRETAMEVAERNAGIDPYSSVQSVVK